MYTKTDVIGTKHWYSDPELTILHREDGSAIEYADGDKSWYINGKLHREDGPAIEHISGDNFWYIKGKLHREDGPACEYTNDDKEYYFMDESYPDIKTDKQWVKFLKLYNFH